MPEKISFHRNVLNGSVVEYFYIPQTKSDFETAISNFSFPASQKLHEIKRESGISKGIKFQLGVKVFFSRYSEENRKEIEIRVWFISNNFEITSMRNISFSIRGALQQLTSRFDSFVYTGSGWKLKKIERLSLQVKEFNIIRGGCSRNAFLPKRLMAAKRALVLIDNNEKEKCFLYALASTLHPVSRNATRSSNKTLNQLIELFHEGDMHFPFKLSDIRAFEKRYTFLSINVYGFEKYLFPYHISPFKDRQYVCNMLLHANHFYAIRNMSALLSRSSTHKKNQRKTYVCNSCLSYFYTRKRFEIHQDLCNGKGPRYEMPDGIKTEMKFKAFCNTISAPFVIYCDIESLIRKEKKVSCGKVTSIRCHTPISVGALTVCRSNSSFSSAPYIYTGNDCIEKLFQHIDAEHIRVSNIMNVTNVELHMSIADNEKFDAAKHCYICCDRFSRSNFKVRDHDHLSGEFRNALCNRCNLTHAKQRHALYVFFHGLSNYDMHFLVKHMHKYENRKIHIIPRTSEKYLSVSIDNVHFKDSYQFLMCSLAELGRNLRTKGEEFFRNVDRYVQDPQLKEIFFSKGVYPYSYMDSEEKLYEKCLPEIEMFKNDLNNENLSEDEYKMAQNAWNILGCSSMKEYMEMYLLGDILILADVFENFRENCLKDYSLDPVYYYSTPHFTFDAFMKSSKMTLELISDVNQYLFMCKGIRGGLCQVSKRYAHANNPCIEGFNPSEPETYILYLDANNLYGKAMMEFLPYKHFQWMSDDELRIESILSISADSEIGCIVEVDFIYPEELHHMHNDYPLAPHKHKVPFDNLSCFSKELCMKNGIKRTTGSEKLMTTFLPRNNYVVHYRNFQLYVSLGMIPVRVHKGIKFCQTPIMRSYVSFNSEKRSQATNSFDTNFYKLLSNSLFGKTIERPEKRTRVHLTASAEKHRHYVGSLCYKESKIIHENLVGVTMGHEIMKVMKPFYIGVSILELSKFHMYNFHYNVMKKFFGTNICLLYTDTDSLIYKITCRDLYSKKLPLLHEFFDFSNYPTDHVLHSNMQKRVPGLFKDETAGTPIKEFVGLRSKMYAFVVGSKENKVAKGVKKCIIDKELYFQDYKTCLFSGNQKENAYKNIISKNHSVFTLAQSKVSLSSFDDKRYLISPFLSFPYGHTILSTENKFCAVGCTHSIHETKKKAEQKKKQ